MEIGSVGIIGAGLMGSGIAEVCARNGIRTLVTEAGSEQLAAGERRVGASLERGRQTGKLSDDDVERILELLTFTAHLEDFAECDFCIEAIVEQLPAKVALFARLDRIVAPRPSSQPTRRRCRSSRSRVRPGGRTGSSAPTSSTRLR